MSRKVASLYPRVLGESFHRLPPILRRFHSQSQGRARGTLSVTRGRGWLRNHFANRFHLPPAGQDVQVCLRVEPWEEGERWVRHFGAICLETHQWLYRGLLIEAAGPLRVGFRLKVGEEELRFEFVRAWLCGIPLPHPLSPHVAARATGTNAGWIIHVRVEMVLLGMLAEYQGEMAPE